MSRMGLDPVAFLVILKQKGPSFNLTTRKNDQYEAA